MLVKAKYIINKKVLSVSAGKEIADVQDIIYDPVENKIKALLVDEGGWFSDARVIPFKEIKSIGKDEILVESEGSVKKAADVSERISGIAKENRHLTHTKIITEEGTKLGKVTDILFDSKTGEVVEFEVSKGGLLDFASGKKRVHVSDIITVGEDATIVKGYTEEEVQKQAGGVQGALNMASQRSQTVFNELRAQVTDTTRRVQRRAKTSDYGKEYIQEAKRQGKKVARGTRDETEVLMDELRQKYQDLKNKPETKKTLNYIQHQIKQLEVMLKQGTTKATKTILEQRKKDALGKYLTKNILLPNDMILAKKGNLITNKLLNAAEKAGVLDQILKYNSDKV